MAYQLHSATQSNGGQPPGRVLGHALLKSFVGGIPSGRLLINTPAGACFVFEGARPGPQADLIIRRWRCLWRVLTRGDIGFAESYMAGEWDSPDLPRLLEFASRNGESLGPTLAMHLPRPLLRFRHALNRNTKRGSRRNIAIHYDLGNAFYTQWLDLGMTYSSGLYSAPCFTLEQAQRAKLDRIIDLLAMSGGERVLEIGCGWGSLAEQIISGQDCTITGLTLSTEQLAYTHKRIGGLGLFHKCDFRLQDYRDVRESFDRVVAIEMLEAVGESYWSTFFAKLRSSLRPGGVAVLQAITIDETRFKSYRRTPDFVQRYIFPGGMLPTTEIIAREITQAELQLVSSERFGESYARTLEEWQRRFQKAWPTIHALGFGNRFKRMWEYYLAYCQAGFETGALNVAIYKIVRAS
jgi:cyclopropane-fatty-acyl-phospholipid synthase